MRKFVIAGAAAFLAISGPAKATYYSNLSIGASIDVTRTTFQCYISDPACYAAYPGGSAYTSFTLPFNYPILFGLDIVEGDNFFSQQFSARGGVSGYIVNTGGIFTGRDLYYQNDSGPCVSSCLGHYDETGTARSFFVVGGVPEPTTWATMLMGFGMIGVSLRRRRRAEVGAQPA